MKKLFLLAVAAVLIIAAMPKDESPADTPAKGSWLMIKAKYDTGPMEDVAKGTTSIKMFTGTRWSAIVYKIAEKEVKGSCGGSYTLKGDQYVETVEFFSYDASLVGKVFSFTLKIENGMLHQSGYIEYKDNKHYLIDEWYKRID